MFAWEYGAMPGELWDYNPLDLEEVQEVGEARYWMLAENSGMPVVLSEREALRYAGAGVEVWMTYAITRPAEAKAQIDCGWARLLTA